MIDIDQYFTTPLQICQIVAKNVKAQRKARHYSQVEMSKRSGVSYASLKRFEQTGEISFVSLVKIAKVLKLEDEIKELFTKKYYSSIQEIIDEQS